MKYAVLKAEPQFLKKLAADFISRFGDSLDAIAYSWMVYVLTGSAALTAMTMAVNTLVSVVLSPFSASLITNSNKKTVLVLCDIGRGCFVTITAVLFFAGQLQPWMIMTITGLNSTLEAFRNPAGMAIFPQIVSRENYTLAMSFSGGLSRVAELIGMGLAGVIVSAWGVTAALLIDAGTFFVSAVILTALRLAPHDKQAVQNAFAEFVRNTKEGFAYMAQNKVIMAICGTACFLNFTIIPLFALQTPYISDSLRIDARGLSVMGVAITAGMGLGSLLVPTLLTWFSRFTLLIGGVLAGNICFCLLAVLPSLPVLWIWICLGLLFFVMGMGLSLPNTVVNVAFMEKTDEQYLARAHGIMNSLCMAAMPAASLLAAALAKGIRVPYIYLVFGSLALLGTLWAAIFVKPLREL